MKKLEKIIKLLLKIVELLPILIELLKALDRDTSVIKSKLDALDLQIDKYTDKKYTDKQVIESIELNKQIN